jgi:hypothetical protein
MTSCRSADPVGGTFTSAARSPCPPALGNPGPSRLESSLARSCTSAAPPDAAASLLIRPTRPLEEAVILADSSSGAGPLPVSEDGRVTIWCTGADERFAWRWFEQLAAQGVRTVLARLDGCLAVFRTPLPLDPDGVVGPGKQRRPCLRCGRSFWSSSPGNRICRFCAIRNAGVMPGFGRPDGD